MLDYMHDRLTPASSTAVQYAAFYMYSQVTMLSAQTLALATSKITYCEISGSSSSTKGIAMPSYGHIQPVTVVTQVVSVSDAAYILVLFCSMFLVFTLSTSATFGHSNPEWCLCVCFTPQVFNTRAC